jgi:hypothetical protein
MCAKVNTTGENKAYDKKYYVLDDDTYMGTITRVAGPFTTPPFEAGGKDQVKVVFDCTVAKEDRRPSGDENAVLPLWVSLVVSKGGKNAKGEVMSNSKLYDILDKANLLDDVNKFVETSGANGEVPDDKLVGFLESYLIKRQAKFLVVSKKNANGEKYSVVKDVVRFLGGMEKVEVEDINIGDTAKDTAKSPVRTKK